MLFGKKGFTLIELIVVIIIVGILASVAIPMIRGNIDKAKKSEAITAMGTIRTAQKAYYAQYNDYPDIGDLNSAVGLRLTDLDGTYFSNACYSLDNGTGAITCNANSSASPAPKYSEVNTLGNITMSWNGATTGY